MLCVPAVQLLPHIQLVKVLSPVCKQDDLTLHIGQLCGHSHAQGERREVQGLLGDHLHITAVRLIREHQGL